MGSGIGFTNINHFPSGVLIFWGVHFEGFIDQIWDPKEQRSILGLGLDMNGLKFFALFRRVNRFTPFSEIRIDVFSLPPDFKYPPNKTRSVFDLRNWGVFNFSIFWLRTMFDA